MVDMISDTWRLDGAAPANRPPLPTGGSVIPFPRSATHGRADPGAIPAGQGPCRPPSARATYSPAEIQVLEDEFARARRHAARPTDPAEAARLASLRRMHRQMAGEPARFADLRDGGMLPKQRRNLNRIVLAAAGAGLASVAVRLGQIAGWW